jgi:hypothetical protein
MNTVKRDKPEEEWPRWQKCCDKADEIGLIGCADVPFTIEAYENLIDMLADTMTNIDLDETMKQIEEERIKNSNVPIWSDEKPKPKIKLTPEEKARIEKIKEMLSREIDEIKHKH